MAKIKSIEIWREGIFKTAEEFRLRSILDDLSLSAKFYYELKEVDILEGDKVVSYGECIVGGNLSMSPEEYQSWDNSNDSAYAWAAEKLNIILV